MLSQAAAFGADHFVMGLGPYGHSGPSVEKHRLSLSLALAICPPLNLCKDCIPVLRNPFSVAADLCDRRQFWVHPSSDPGRPV